MLKGKIEIDELAQAISRTDANSIQEVRIMREIMTRIDEKLFKNGSIAIRGVFIAQVDQYVMQNRGQRHN